FLAYNIINIKIAGGYLANVLCRISNIEQLHGAVNSSGKEQTFAILGPFITGNMYIIALGGKVNLIGAVHNDEVLLIAFVAVAFHLQPDHLVSLVKGWLCIITLVVGSKIGGYIGGYVI